MTAFEDLENEDLSINKTALDTYVQEEYIKFIMGDRPLSAYDETCIRDSFCPRLMAMRLRKDCAVA